MSLLDSGCPVGRHELKNEEWRMLGIIRNERDRIVMEERSKRPNREFPGTE